MPSVVCCIRSCRWIRKRLHVFASTFVVAGWVARLVLADALVFWWRIYSFINLISFFYSSSLQVVHPKSDQQRHRLAEAVKNIFIFRSLDPVHISPPPLSLYSLVIRKAKSSQHQQWCYYCSLCMSSITKLITKEKKSCYTTRRRRRVLPVYSTERKSVLAEYRPSYIWHQSLH
jgi:hypothetical protein